jgi:predicted DCC family thiol-disulfide oxidoreductase YuxK
VNDRPPDEERRGHDEAILFYDGSCGLCHVSVRLALAADRHARLRFAPLGGETFLALVPADERPGLPDSFVLRTREGTLLTRWAAVVEVMRRLGWPWPALGTLGGLVPRRLGDALYDVVARVRHRLLAHPADRCPIVPRSLRERFLA